MHNTIVKRTLLFLAVSVIMTLACDLSVNIAPTNEVPTAETTAVPIDPPSPTPEVFISVTQAIPSTEIASVTPVIQPSPVNKTAVTFGRLSLDIPSSVANGASGQDYPRVDAEDAAYWEKTPGHLQVSLKDYYVLQGKIHQPQIYVYPAMAYVELSPAAFESMHRLRNVMNPGAPITADQLPAVPFFNAAQLFASNIQAVSFQNGSGVRFLTEYGQYPAPVNNHELFYQFQGFTNDGEYYIVAILPITAPMLAETSDAGSHLQPGGVPYPYLAEGSNAEMETYCTSIIDLLNASPSDVFTPTLNQLDLLIQSIQIIP